jgi:hypothetical protein
MDRGDHFVIATGQFHSIAEFAAAALARVGIAEWDQWVETDPHLVPQVDASASSAGDASKAQRELGWRLTVDFTDLVAAMVDHDLVLLTASDRWPNSDPVQRRQGTELDHAVAGHQYLRGRDRLSCARTR